MDGLTLVTSITDSWGPPALIAAFIILFFTGKILSERTLTKLLDAKNAQLETQQTNHNALVEAQKTYYEGRIAELNAGFTERLGEIRRTNDTISSALQGAVDNVTKLIAQVDELQELTRVATPVIVAQRAAVESNDG